MRFVDFERKAYSAGLTATQHQGGTHWRLTGGRFAVNFYPTSNKIYVNGMAEGFAGNATEAIKIANNGPPVQPKTVARSKSYKRVKKQMLRRTRTCHWCRCQIDMKTATVDHVVPLSRGGSNQSDNLVLACKPCNQARASTVQPPPKVRQGGAV